MNGCAVEQEASLADVGDNKVDVGSLELSWHSYSKVIVYWGFSLLISIVNLVLSSPI